LLPWQDALKVNLLAACVKLLFSLKVNVMNAQQCRMARAGLDWTLDRCAAQSGVNRRTILNFENGGPASDASLVKIRSAFESAGIVFVERGVYAGGVVPPREVAK
jgi:DNA-binding XRE family transcriptional regulator